MSKSTLRRDKFLQIVKNMNQPSMRLTNSTKKARVDYARAFSFFICYSAMV